MQTSIDGAGRIVVPKALRDALGLRAGTRLEVEQVEGRLELRPLGPAVQVTHQRGRPVLEADGDLEPLTAEQVRALVERSRP